jgi:hypothetical protein
MLTVMEYENLYQDGMPVPPPPEPPRKSGGRVRRIAASGAAAAVLLGGGAAIGIAMTGGASADTSGSGTTQGLTAAAQKPAAECRGLAALAKRNGHPVAARRIAALCGRRPLLRVVAAGGIYGTVTYKAKDGTRTLAFERGSVASVVGSVITVRAANGTTWTWDIISSTVIREKGQKVAQSSLADGDQVLVAGQVVSGANDARLIRIRAVG